MEPKDTTSKVGEQGQSKLIDSNNLLRNLKAIILFKNFLDICLKENI